MSSTDRQARQVYIGALLRLSYNAMTQRLVEWLADAGYDDLQPTHSSVIQPLWDSPKGKRLTELAREAQITKQSMGALVDHLEHTGYVERVADEDDRRASRVRLTERGRGFARDVRRFGRTVEQELGDAIGTARVEELCASLQRLLDHFEQGS